MVGSPGCFPLWFLPQRQLILVEGKHLPRQLIGMIIPPFTEGVADESGAFPPLLAARDGDIAPVPTQVDGVADVLGLGGRPQVVLMDSDTQRFATAVFPDDPVAQLTTLLDHQRHPGGGDGAPCPAGLPGEAAVPVRVGDGPAPDPAPLAVTADDLGPEATHRTWVQR